MSSTLFRFALGRRRVSLLAGNAALLCLLLLGGCANLGAIQEFGKLSADSAAYTKLTDQYINGPEVSKIYTLEKNSEARASLTKLADSRKPDAARLLLLHRAVADYMETLADLAADDLTVADDEIDGLIKAGIKADYVDEVTAAPARAIAKLLTEAALNGYRQRELNKVIAQGNQPLQDAIAQMLRLMVAFDASLADERARHIQRQRLLLTMARERDREPVAAELVWTHGNVVTAEFSQREKAIPAYVAILQQIAAGHQSLYDNRERLSNKETFAQIKKFSKRIRTLHKAMRTEKEAALEAMSDTLANK